MSPRLPEPGRAATSSRLTTRAIAAGVVVAALIAMPAPLLPPHRLAQGVQSALGIEWKAAYLFAAIGLHLAFYGSLGVLATLALDRASSVRKRLLQAAILPCLVVGVAVLIRSIKLGHVPVAANLIVPVLACVAGVGLGLALRYRGAGTRLALASVLAGTALWGWSAAPSSGLARATQMHLQRLAAAVPMLPAGEARFGAVVRTAFAPMAGGALQSTAVEHNRAAILALGIVLGHERLARMVGVETPPLLLDEIAAVRAGTALREREDWARHYALSAALAVLQHPFASDAAGLMKEQLDALTQGSGFSFGDLAADRAGVRFAAAATHSDAAATGMQSRLRRGFVIADFFPAVADLPENLTVEAFRRDYGGVGSRRYRQLAAEIEARLDGCAALSPRL